jgi:hypothetical protein
MQNENNSQVVVTVIIWVLNKYKKGDFFLFICIYDIHSTLFHLPPLRFHCVGECLDRTLDSDCGIGCQTL